MSFTTRLTIVSVSQEKPVARDEELELFKQTGRSRFRLEGDLLYGEEIDFSFLFDRARDRPVRITIEPISDEELAQIADQEKAALEHLQDYYEGHRLAKKGHDW